MTSFINYFFVGADQFHSLGGGLILVIGLTWVGSSLFKRERLVEADVICGWAVAIFLYTIIGVLTPLSFSFVAWFLVAIIIVSGIFQVYRGRSLLPANFIRVTVLALPLLLIASAMVASQWDEFSHWVPSIRYLFEVDQFPNLASSYTGGSFPGYPYNWLMLPYTVSEIGGRFVESAGGVLNVLLLLSFGLVIVRVLRLGAGQSQKETSVSWLWAAVAVASVALLNPSFVQKVVLTSYADTSTAVTAGFGAVAAWMILGALASGNREKAATLAWQFGLIVAVLINIKQANLVLVVILLFGFGVAALRDPQVSIAGILRLLPQMIIPAAAVYILWRYHVKVHLPPQSEAVFMPYESWNVEHIGQILLKMVSVLAKKGYYFALMILAVGFGVRGLIKFKGEFDRLAIFVGSAFLGYNAFLLLIFVAQFGKTDALRVASLWRYNMHLGLLAVLFGAFALGLLWRLRLQERVNVRLVGMLSVVMVLVAPFVFAKKLRFDLEPHKPHYRMVGSQMLNHLEKDARIVVIDPHGSGESAVITKFELHKQGRLLGYFSAWQSKEQSVVDTIFARLKPTNVVVHSVEPEFKKTLGVELRNGLSYLLKARDGGGWDIVRSWPYPDNG